MSRKGTIITNNNNENNERKMNHSNNKGLFHVVFLFDIDDDRRTPFRKFSTIFGTFPAFSCINAVMMVITYAAYYIHFSVPFVQIYSSWFIDIHRCIFFFHFLIFRRSLPVSLIWTISIYLFEHIFIYQFLVDPNADYSFSI